jgi:hypothetical protein
VATFVQHVRANAGNGIPNEWRSQRDRDNIAGDLLGYADSLAFSIDRPAVSRAVQSSSWYIGTMVPNAAAPRDDAEFLAALESATLAPATFGHEAHLRAAYLVPPGRDAGAGRRPRRARDPGIRERAGRPRPYHETITLAHLLLLRRHLHERGDGGGWEGFGAANPELFDRSCCCAGTARRAGVAAGAGRVRAAGATAAAGDPASAPSRKRWLSAARRSSP